MILAGPLTLWEGVLPFRVRQSWDPAGLCHCALQRMGRGGGTGEQLLKPNCVLSNLSTEDSSPSPSWLADKCRSRPPVCQGCLNWYQDVPGLHRPSACSLLPQPLASRWLPPPPLGGTAVSTAPREAGEQQGLHLPGHLLERHPLPRGGNSVDPAQDDRERH